MRAILDRKKTQTRRVMNPQLKNLEVTDIGEGCAQVVWHQPPKITRNTGGGSSNGGKDILENMVHEFSPFGKPGDQLWVKERIDHLGDGVSWYAADQSQTVADAWPWKIKTLPSMFCPRGLSRIDLEVENVRVERVQEISEEDSKAEGVDDVSMVDVKRQATWSRRDDFAQLWDTLNAKRGYGWESNPFVWVIEFKRISG